MKVSKKYKDLIKNRICVLFTSVIIISTLLVSAKLTTFSMPKNEINVKKPNYIDYQTAYDDHVLLYSSFEDETKSGKIIDEITNVEPTIIGGAKVYTTSKKSKIGSGSCYFPGTAGQRLIENVDSLNFGTNDFTVQFWAYAESQTMGYSVFFGNDNNSDLVFFCTDGENGNNITLVASGTRVIKTQTAYKQNEWVNYAIVRKNGVLTIYENGVNIGSTSSYTSANINLSTLAIGGNTSTSNTAFKGYIDDFSIYDTALYDTDFTVSETAQNNATNVYMSFDDVRVLPKDDLLDEEYEVYTTGSIGNTTSNKKNGNRSCYFDGKSEQRLILNRDNLNFGTNDFTVDFWSYAESQTMGYSAFFANDNNTDLVFFCADNSNSGRISLQAKVGNYTRIINTQSSYKQDEWVNYRVVRKNGVFKLYENGKMIGSTFNYTNVNVDLSRLSIGGNSSTGNTAFKGYIDDFTIYDIALDDYEVLNTRQKYIKVGESYNLDIQNTEETVLNYKKNYAKTDFTWTSYNDDVATVDSNGVVTGKSVGFTTIVAKSKTSDLEARAIIYVTSNEQGAVAIPQVVPTHNGAVLILKEDGTVWGSGLNTSGELAQGDLVNKSETVRIKTGENAYLENIIQIQSGEASGYALDTNGEVWSWGLNNYGQLGLGDTTNRVYATKITNITGYDTMPKVLQISGGYEHFQVLLEDGQVYSTGRNNYGQLGNANYGTANTLVKCLGAENIVFASSQQWNNAFLTQDGKILSCGYSGNGELGQETTTSTNALGYVKNEDKTGYLEDVVQVISAHSSMAIIESGEVYIWGLNNYGQLGNGTTTNSTTPIKIDLASIGITKAKYVASAQCANFIQDISGKVYAAGYNGWGRAAISATPVDTNTKYMPVLDEDGNIFDDALIISNAPAYKVYGIVSTSGNVYVAGSNENGQYGNGTTQNSYYLERYGHNSIILSDRQIYMKANTTKKVEINKFDVFNTFINPTQEYEWKSYDESVATVSQDGTITGVGLGNTTIVLKDKRSLEESRLMVHVYNDKQGAVAVPMVSNSYSGATIVLKEDGTVWTSGVNTSGECGTGDNTNKNEYTKVKIDANTYLTNVVKVEMGGYHTIALTKDNEVYVWGANTYGQLGLGDTTNRNYATKLPEIEQGKKAIDITAGWRNNSILLDDGTVYTAGSGEYYSAGDGTGNTYNTFVKANLIDNAVSVVGNEWQRMAIDADGTIWAWGCNVNGRLGDGTTASKSIPIHVRNKQNQNNLRNVIELKNNMANIALLEDRTTVLWGLGGNGEMGNGGTSDSTLPLDVKIYDETTSTYVREENIKKIGMEHGQPIIERANGEILVTGYNANGQLSIGTTANSTKFVNMKNVDGTNVNDVFALPMGYSYSNDTIIRKDGTVWNSGTNANGAYGIGNTITATGNYLTKAGINKIELNVKNEYIKVGETIDINVEEAHGFNVFIEDTINQTDWTWTSSNDDVASINNNGIVTGQKIGYTTITGINQNKGLKARAIINVYRDREGAITRPDVQIGEGFTVALKEDGTVWTSGLNDCGQLGNGTTVNSNIPVQVKIDENTNLTNVKEISVGKFKFVLAVTFDGKVYGWGENSSYSPIAQPAGKNYTYATEMNLQDGSHLTNAMSVSSGDAHSMVLTQDGKVYVAGHNYWYQNLSTGRETNISYLVDTGVVDAIKISAGYSDCSAMISNGDTFVWGHNAYGELETRGNPSIKSFFGNDIVDISLDGFKCLVLKEDGTLWGTGLNTSGQLGVGDATNKNVLTKVIFPEGTAKIKYISGSSTASIISTVDGRIYSTGQNTYGQAGNGTTTNNTTFVVMENEDGTDITDCLILCDGGYTCAGSAQTRNYAYIKPDGTVWIAGDNTYGQMGNRTNISSAYMTKFGIDEVKTNLRNEYIKIGDTLDINVEKANGFNVFIEDAINQSDWTWTSSNDDVASIDANSGVITGKSIGYTTITGINQSKGLKARAIINVYRNKDGAITVPRVANGENFTAVLREDGTVWTSGLNDNGQLGNGTTTNSSVPVQVKKDSDNYLTDIIDLSVGPNFAAALSKDGFVYVWGYNGYGSLGQGNTTNSLYAIKMKGVNSEGELSNIIQISVGRHEIFALDKDGYIFGSGYGAHNAYLDGITSQHNSTTKVVGIDNCVSIEIGVCDVFTMLSNGETWNWGHNPYGELANGSTANVSPTKYKLGNDIVQASSSGYSTVVIKEDGYTYTAGYNNVGQLGLEDTINRLTLTKTKLSENGIKAKYAIMSEYYQTVLGKDGKVYVVGVNTNGQLSQGTVVNTSTYVAMLNENGTEVEDCLFIAMKGSTYVNATQKTNSIIRKNGTVWISGNNTYGQFRK